MRRITIPGAQMALPRLINGVELASENDPSVNLASVIFELASAVVKKNNAAVALALTRPGTEQTFACIYLDTNSAKTLAKTLAEVAED